jgi:beta-glucosidase-like glycosyl hydrolase
MDAQRGIARRMVIGLPEGGATPGWEKDYAMFPPAGVIVFRRDARDLDDLRRLTTRLRDLARPRRIFIGVDEEGGWVSQLWGWLEVPPNALLVARGGGEDAVELVARVTGERLRALGIDWVFAPVADVNVEPRNPVIGPRSFGPDPARVSRCVAASLRGFRAARIASCLKHFPGHGDTAIDSHHALPESLASRDGLEAGALVPFRENLDAPSIMTAHVTYRALDTERPATFSRAVVTGLLRDRLGYSGVCVTDALEMKGASAGRTAFDAGRLALDAGCDLLLYAHWNEDVRRARLELAKALVDGAIGRDGFEAGRTRLAAFDRAHPEPTAEDLARPAASLTPADWEKLLQGIAERGLEVDSLPSPDARPPLHLEEPEFRDGPSLSEELRRAGVALAATRAEGTPVVAVASRVPPPPEEIERIRSICRGRPTVLIGLQNDAFLGDLPEAAMRISAADSTPITRRAVARLLARSFRV